MTGVRAKSRRTSPAREARLKVTAPASNPNAPNAIGGSWVSVRADSTKYDVAPSIAKNAQPTPTQLTEPTLRTSSINSSPAAHHSVPNAVRRVGRTPWRSHSHAITPTGAVYSISSASPTSICAIALK